jgi:hypothetical protein
MGTFGTRIVLKMPMALFLLLSLSSITWSQTRIETSVGTAAGLCSVMAFSHVHV